MSKIENNSVEIISEGAYINPTIKMGMVFVCGEPSKEACMICCVDENTFKLISLSNGNRWTSDNIPKDMSVAEICKKYECTYLGFCDIKVRKK